MFKLEVSGRNALVFSQFKASHEPGGFPYKFGITKDEELKKLFCGSPESAGRIKPHEERGERSTHGLLGRHGKERRRPFGPLFRVFPVIVVSHSATRKAYFGGAM
jgi:hypothetical protein